MLTTEAVVIMLSIIIFIMPFTTTQAIILALIIRTVKNIYSIRMHFAVAQLVTYEDGVVSRSEKKSR